MVRNSLALGRHRYRLTHEDRMWSPLPMFHIAAVLPMLATFDVGGTYLTMGNFDAGVALDMLEKYKVTALYPSSSRSCRASSTTRHSRRRTSRTSG